MADKEEPKIESRKTVHGQRYVVIYATGKEEKFVTKAGAERWVELWKKMHSHG